MTTETIKVTDHRLILKRVGLLALLLVLFAFSVNDWTAYVYPLDIVSILLPLGLIALIVPLVGKQSGFAAVEALALPIGLFMAGSGITQIFSGLTVLDDTPYVTGRLVMPAIYVGIIAGVLHCWDDLKDDTISNLSLPATVACAVVVLAGFLWGNLEYLEELLNRSEQWLLQLGIILALTLGRSKGVGVAQALCTSSLVSILIMTVVGIIELVFAGQETTFSDLPTYQQAIVPAYTAMTAGLLVYTLAILLSFRTGELEALDLSTKNWHLIEAFSFLIFITLAPPDIYHFISGG